MDEGDEDRLAGIDDEEGSDLELGDDAADTGKRKGQLGVCVAIQLSGVYP